MRGRGSDQDESYHPDYRLVWIDATRVESIPERSYGVGRLLYEA